MKGLPFTHIFFFFNFFGTLRRSHIAQTGLEFKDPLMTASQVSLGSAVFAAMPVCLPSSLVNPSFVLVSAPLFSSYQDPLVFILTKFSVLYRQAGKEYIPSYVEMAREQNKG